MGIGHLKAAGVTSPAELTLVLSFRYDETDPDVIDSWHWAFRHASQLLSDATLGRLKLGTVYFANTDFASHEADFYLLDCDPPCAESFDIVGKMCVPDEAMAVHRQRRQQPLTLVHELGHYVFGLGEEYTGIDPTPECTGNAGTGACIMEFTEDAGLLINTDGSLIQDGQVFQFCVAGNHDPDGDTQQAEWTRPPGCGPCTGNIGDDSCCKGLSCWESIGAQYASKGLPTITGGYPPGAYVPTAVPPDIGWVRMQQEKRVVLLLDKSGSMMAGSAIEGVKSGAEYWMKGSSAIVHDRLAVVPYDRNPNPVVPLANFSLLSPSQIDVEVGNVNTALVAGGLTSIGDALIEARAQVLSPANNHAASQVVILFTDGVNTAGLPPNDPQVLPFAEQAMRVFTLGFGPNVNGSRLQEIATMTCGEYFPIAQNALNEPNETDITDALIDVDDLTASGLVAYVRDALDPVGRWSFEAEALIEGDATMARFTLTHLRSRPVEIEVFYPDGTQVQTSDPGVSRFSSDTAPFVSYVVNSPPSGIYRLRAFLREEDRDLGSVLSAVGGLIGRAFAAVGRLVGSGSGVAAERLNGRRRLVATAGRHRFTLRAVSSNSKIAAGVAGPQTLYAAGDTVPLEVQLAEDIPMTGLSRVTVHELLRGGGSQSYPRPGRGLNWLMLLLLLIVALAVAALAWWVAGPTAGPAALAALLLILAPYVWSSRLNRGRSIVLEESPAGSGQYRGNLRFSRPGSYELVAVLENDGSATAKAQSPHADAPSSPTTFDPVTRLRKFFVHVGPLGTGPDPPPTDG